VIHTLTLNPAIDQMVLLEEFLPGDANRIMESRTDPGGKGINVSRALLELGCESVAMGFAAGTRGRFVEAALKERGIYTDFVRIPGKTRTNITIIDQKHNTTTTLNEPGPQTDPHHMANLTRRLRKHLSADDWLVIGGSVPPGLPTDVYGGIIEMANAMGVRCVLDTEGSPFRSAIGAKPYMVKPNRAEVERLLGHLPKSKDPMLDAADQIHALGVEVVVLSQGARGAVMVTSQGAWRAYPPALAASNTVGTGDAMVAGMVQVLSHGGSPEEALRLGSAAGAAAALTVGTQPCRPADVVRLLSRVQVFPAPRAVAKARTRTPEPVGV
jgi:1-phosphofructokinase